MRILWDVSAAMIHDYQSSFNMLDQIFVLLHANTVSAVKQVCLTVIGLCSSPVSAWPCYHHLPTHETAQTSSDQLCQHGIKVDRVGPWFSALKAIKNNGIVCLQFTNIKVDADNHPPTWTMMHRDHRFDENETLKCPQRWKSLGFHWRICFSNRRWKQLLLRFFHFLNEHFKGGRGERKPSPEIFNLLCNQQMPKFNFTTTWAKFKKYKTYTYIKIETSWTVPRSKRRCSPDLCLLLHQRLVSCVGLCVTLKVKVNALF